MITKTRRPLSTRERLMIFTRAEGICHICGDRIDGTRELWDVEHVIPLEMGGDEAKGSENLLPAHRQCHRTKTIVDSWQLAKAKRREAKHVGAHKPRSPLRNEKWKKRVDGTVVPRDAS